MARQLMLWETDVVSAGDGSARVVARKPVLEGNVDEARKILGGKAAVSRHDVYRLIRDGYVRAWKVRPGAVRGDGKASNTKLVVDLESVVRHRERMQEERAMAAERPRQNCMAF